MRCLVKERKNKRKEHGLVVPKSLHPIRKLRSRVLPANISKVKRKFALIFLVIKSRVCVAIPQVIFT